MSRSKDAWNAYENNDLKGVVDAHEKSRIEAEPWHDVGRGEHIKDIIYAANDGIITTFAIAAGATGALLSSTLIVILGFANLLAAGFSMAIANYLGTQSEIEYAEMEKERETWEVEKVPEAEREEVRQIFTKKGLAPHLADRLTEIVASNKDVWVELMMTEELGIAPKGSSSPLKNGLLTFFAFVGAGFMPLIFFVLSRILDITNTLALSLVTTMISLFIVGSLRGRVTRRNWLRSGFEVLLAGGAAAAVAYIMGYLLKLIAG